MKNYVEENITQKSHTTLKYAMKMLANSSEAIIFVFLGVCTVNDNHHWNTPFVVLTIVFCLIYRAIGMTDCHSVDSVDSELVPTFHRSYRSDSFGQSVPFASSESSRAVHYGLRWPQRCRSLRPDSGHQSTDHSYARNDGHNHNSGRLLHGLPSGFAN